MVALLREIDELVLGDMGPKPAGDFDRLIRAQRIEHVDLVGPAHDGIERLREVGFLVIRKRDHSEGTRSEVASGHHPLSAARTLLQSFSTSGHR